MKRIHRPIATFWHTGLACLLVAMSTTLTVKPAHIAAKPVVLTKGGHVIYDSGARAQVIAAVWNITPDNMESYKKWGIK
jgi:hypothetical protein